MPYDARRRVRAPVNVEPKTHVAAVVNKSQKAVVRFARVLANRERGNARPGSATRISRPFPRKRTWGECIGAKFTNAAVPRNKIHSSLEWLFRQSWCSRSSFATDCWALAREKGKGRWLNPVFPSVSERSVRGTISLCTRASPVFSNSLYILLAVRRCGVMRKSHCYYPFNFSHLYLTL